jgi:hypothetical protein
VPSRAPAQKNRFDCFHGFFSYTRRVLADSQREPFAVSEQAFPVRWSRTAALPGPGSCEPMATASTEVLVRGRNREALHSSGDAPEIRVGQSCARQLAHGPRRTGRGARGGRQRGGAHGAGRGGTGGGRQRATGTRPEVGGVVPGVIVKDFPVMKDMRRSGVAKFTQPGNPTGNLRRMRCGGFAGRGGLRARSCGASKRQHDAWGCVGMRLMTRTCGSRHECAAIAQSRDERSSPASGPGPSATAPPMTTDGRSCRRRHQPDLEGAGHARPTPLL